MSDAELLRTRFCDLRLTLRNSEIEHRLREIRRSLQARGIRFRPHVWLSEEWFSPDGVPGIAVPFYMAHPRLQRLERRFMGEVEGGNANWLTRILRHEIGHALDNAYRLRRRKEWRRTFGKASRPYPDIYRPRPASQRLRAAPGPLVRAEPSHRGLRRNVRGLAAAARALASRVPGLAGAAQAGVRRQADGAHQRHAAHRAQSRT